MFVCVREVRLHFHLTYSAACVSPALLHAQRLDSVHRAETPPWPAEHTRGEKERRSGKGESEEVKSEEKSENILL